MTIRDWIPERWRSRQGVGPEEPVGNGGTLRHPAYRFFDDFFRSFETDYDLAPIVSSSLFSHGLRPLVDVSETEDEIQVEVELPGLSEDEVEITLSDDVLCIRGVKRPMPEEEQRRYYLRERKYGAFYREIRLWTEVDPEAVDAQFENGVLTVRLPKVLESARTRAIPVRSA